MRDDFDISGCSSVDIIDAIEHDKDCFYVDKDGKRVLVHVNKFDPNRVVRQLENY